MKDKTREFLTELKELLEKYNASFESICDVIEIGVDGEWPVEIDTYINDKTISDTLNNE
jgi:hypothetical protein